MSDIDTDVLRRMASELSMDGADEDQLLQASSMLASAANEIDSLRLQCKRNLCPNWDSEEGECAD